MKKTKLSIIICIVMALVLICATGCAGGVDKEYEYNTEIIKNSNAPSSGDVDIKSIEYFTPDFNQNFVELPYTVKDTDIEIIAIGSYTGDYIESELSKDVDDDLAILVKNNSKQIISYSSITVDCGNDKVCTFSPTNLPSGQCSLVFPNSDAVSYADVTKFECTDSMAVMTDSLAMLDGTVGIDYKNGEFILTNLTGENLGDVYIRYRNCTEDNIYLGGITYSTVQKGVEPFETYKIPVDNFSTENSVIVSVESIK